MLSDEMITGSVTTSDAEKRAYASRSHSWNTEQRRFREAFPEVSQVALNVILADQLPKTVEYSNTDSLLQYCSPTMRDLPNMGQKERGKPSTSATQPVRRSEFLDRPSQNQLR